MQGLLSVQRAYKLAVQNGVGQVRAGLAAAHPNDFQYQFVAFELTDYGGRTIDLLIFPITPSQTTYSHTASIDIKKTATGVITQYNSHFTPADITLRGTFGRRFKVMLGRREYQATAFKPFGDAHSDYDFAVKTGYGVTKAMENLIDGSRACDEQGRSNLLYYYNALRGEHFMVEVTNKRFEMNESKNDLVTYALTMKSVAPASATPSKTKATSLRKLFQKGYQQRALTGVGYEVIQTVSEEVGKIIVKAL